MPTVCLDWQAMTLADLDRSGTEPSRLPLVLLLCAIALGIVGMHGLASEPDSAGHHSTQVVTVSSDHTHVGHSMTGAAVAEEAPEEADTGILALCLMVLTPGLALGLWLLGTFRGAGWRLPRLVARVSAAVDVAVLPPPYQRRLTVLRI